MKTSAIAAIIVVLVVVAGGAAGAVLLTQNNQQNQNHNMEQLSLQCNFTDVVPGDTYSIDANIQPTNTTDKNLIWSISDKRVSFTADGSKLTFTLSKSIPVNTKFNITAKSNTYNLSDSIEMTVVQSNEVAINNYVSKLVDTFKEPEITEITESMADEDATDNGYTLTSSLADQGYRYKYTTHKATNTYDEIINLGAMDSIYFPGSILSLSYDNNDNKIIKSLNIDRAAMNLSLNLETAKNVNSDYIACSIEDPTLSSVRTAVSRMVNGAISDESSIPCVLSCEFVDITSDKALALALGAEVNIGRLNTDLSVNYDQSESKTHAALIFKQVYFTVDMDRPTNGAAGVFSDIGIEELSSKVKAGENLIYTSVVYGKIAIISIETDKSMSELKAAFNLSYSKKVDIEASLDYALQDGKTTMSYFIYGGDIEEIGVVQQSNISDVANILVENPKSSPKPIGYRFYYLNDGTLANISEYTEYTTRKNIPIQLDYLGLDTEDHIDTAYPGERVKMIKTINPSNAIVYKSEDYSVNVNGKYAYFDKNTSELVISDKAKEIIDTDITVTLIITQLIEGEIHIVTATCTIDLQPIPATDLQIVLSNRSTATADDSIANRGEVFTFNAIVTPDNATYSDVNWTYPEDKITVVKETGRSIIFSIIDEAAGEIVLTAAHQDNLTRTWSMNVNEPVSSVSITHDSSTYPEIQGTPTANYIIAGSSIMISSTINPKNATICCKQWSVSQGTYTVLGDSIKLDAPSDATGTIMVSLTVDNIYSNTLTITINTEEEAELKHTVKFINEGSITTFLIKDGNTVTNPPTVNDYTADWSYHTFVGWTEEGSEYVINDIANYEIHSDITFVSKWSITPVPQYTVFFKNGNDIVASQTVYEDTYITINVPSLNQYDNNGTRYTHAGWCLGDATELTNPATYAVTETTIFNAKWSTEPSPQYYVYFYDGDVLKETRQIYHNMTCGSDIPELPQYTSSGKTYTHTGWILGKNNNTVDPSTYIITEETRFVAVWDYTINAYENYTLSSLSYEPVVYLVNGGTLYINVTSYGNSPRFTEGYSINSDVINGATYNCNSFGKLISNTTINVTESMSGTYTFHYERYSISDGNPATLVCEEDRVIQIIVVDD